MRTIRSQDSNLSQLDKFKEAAKALECDDGEARFKERLAKIAVQKVKMAPPTERT